MEGINEDEAQEMEDLEDLDPEDSEADAEVEEFIGAESMEDDEDYLDSEREEDFEDTEESDENFDFGGSEPEPLGGIYGLFKETLNRKDSKKVSNLTNEELGQWNLSVRDCERIALISKTFKHPGVQAFFRDQSRIITDTAMSRKGWFAELFVTSKKYASRASSSSITSTPQSPTKTNKWKIFSGKRAAPQPQFQE